MRTEDGRPAGAAAAIVRVAALVFFGSVFSGCGESGPARGSEGGWCYSDGTCNEGLICLDKHCVNPFTMPDAAPLPDAPPAADARPTADAVPHDDALYCPGMPDASTLPDASLADASPDAASSADAATPPCDPVLGTGCGPGEKCTWVFEAPLVAHTSCAADGWVTTPDCPCVLDEASGVDDCHAGMYCTSGTCQRICSTDPESCPPGFRCRVRAALFDDVDGVGICDPSCDPVAQDCATWNQACYLSVFTGVSSCNLIPAEAVGRVQGDACYGPQPANCYLNGCDEGYAPLLPDATCAFFCNPIDNWSGNLQGLDGDPAGITCAFTSTERPDGPGASFECRFIQSFYPNADQVPATIGMCVAPDDYGGSCATFDYDSLVADIGSGAFESETYCDEHPDRCMFDCISLATFSALTGSLKPERTSGPSD